MAMNMLPAYGSMASFDPQFFPNYPATYNASMMSQYASPVTSFCPPPFYDVTSSGLKSESDSSSSPSAIAKLSPEEQQKYPLLVSTATGKGEREESGEKLRKERYRVVVRGQLDELITFDLFRYRDKRDRNNLAAKQSRIKRSQREKCLQDEVSSLKAILGQLRQENMQWQHQDQVNKATIHQLNQELLELRSQVPQPTKGPELKVLQDQTNTHFPFNS